jgi:hypothetical protein
MILPIAFENTLIPKQNATKSVDFVLKNITEHIETVTVALG